MKKQHVRMMNRSELQRHDIDGMLDPYFTIKGFTNIDFNITGPVSIRIKPAGKATGYGHMFDALIKKLMTEDGLPKDQARKRAQQSLIDVYGVAHDISNGCDYLDKQGYARDVRLYYEQ